MGPDLTKHAFLPTASIIATGPDALTFLQGQFTQELRGLDPSRGAYGLWLNAKGKVLADSVILFRDKDSYLILSEFSSAETLLERLNAYLIADEVELSDETGKWSATWHFAVPPVATGRALAFVPGPVDRWLGVSSIGEASTPAVTEPSESVASDAASAYSLFRYTHRLPAIPAEFGEADLPQEAGLETHAVSFTKGCYLGQEVMARLHAMGQVRRQLVLVTGTGKAPAAKTTVYSGAKACGELRGSAGQPNGGWSGLAMLTRHAITEGQPLTCEGGEILATWPKA